MTSWTSTAIALLEADANRSADTHLHVFPLPADWGIDLYLKDESVHATGSLKHRLARSLILYGLVNGRIAPAWTVSWRPGNGTAERSRDAADPPFRPGVKKSRSRRPEPVPADPGSERVGAGSLVIPSGSLVPSRTMADLTAALTALQALQSEDVTVGSEGSTARVVIHYLDTAPAGTLTQEKASYEFTVEFDTDAGEYRLSSTQRASAAGPGGAGASVQKNSGTAKSFSYSKTIGPGGSVTSSFDSRPWEDAIRQAVEGAGWTRKKGLLGKLFGR